MSIRKQKSAKKKTATKRPSSPRTVTIKPEALRFKLEAAHLKLDARHGAIAGPLAAQFNQQLQLAVQNAIAEDAEFQKLSAERDALINEAVKKVVPKGYEPVDVNVTTGRIRLKKSTPKPA